MVRAAISAAVIACVGAGCSPAPTFPSSTPSAVQSVAATASNPSSSAPRPITVKIQDVRQEFTTPFLEATTDGTSIIWSSGAPDPTRGPAPDLWRLVPDGANTGEPERIFANPERDSVLAIVGGDGSGSYAFVEQNFRTLGDSGWRLWYLPAGEATPTLVDEGDVGAGVLPFFSLTTDRLVWAVLHGEDPNVESQLLELTFETGKQETLLTLPAEESQVLYPSVDGDRLVYSVMTANDERTALTGEVFLMQLRRGEEARLLSGTENAFMGVVHGDWVVWQRPALDSPLNGGQLVALSLVSGETHDIALGESDEILNYHTVGNRYVAAESEVINRLYLYDLHDRQTVLVEELEDAPEGEREAVDVRPRVAGDLLVYVRGSDFPETDLVLKWAALPPLPAE